MHRIEKAVWLEVPKKDKNRCSDIMILAAGGIIAWVQKRKIWIESIRDSVWSRWSYNTKWPHHSGNKRHEIQMLVCSTNDSQIWWFHQGMARFGMVHKIWPVSLILMNEKDVSMWKVEQLSSVSPAYRVESSRTKLSDHYESVQVI